MSRCEEIDTSLVEYTMTFSVLCRPDTSGAPESDTWAVANSRSSEKMVKCIVDFIEAGIFDGIDSPIICEAITSAVRGIKLHSGTGHCEHSD